jgi:UDP-3-O-[3-hydroxymyristoyl] glucosamine N-acyltransferase
MTYVSARAQLAEGVFLGRNVAILGPCRIGAGVVIEDNCVIGKPSPSALRDARWPSSQTGISSRESAGYDAYDAAVDASTFVGDGCVILAATLIYSGVQLHEDVLCEEQTVIRDNTRVGRGTQLKYGARISSHVAIGRGCRISGFVANDCRIGDQTSSFGQLVHAYTKYGGGRRDPSPALGDRVTVGVGALVIGGIAIADDCYVAAGSIVTTDVPPGTVVTGVNTHTPLEGWLGQLKDDYPRSFP